MNGEQCYCSFYSILKAVKKNFLPRFFYSFFFLDHIDPYNNKTKLFNSRGKNNTQLNEFHADSNNTDSDTYKNNFNGNIWTLWKREEICLQLLDIYL